MIYSCEAEFHGIFERFFDDGFTMQIPQKPPIATYPRWTTPIKKKYFNVCSHGLRTPNEAFFIKILNFWAWADNWADKFWGFFGILN